MAEPPRILSIGATEAWQEAILAQLSWSTLQRVGSGGEALKLLEDWQPDLCLLELVLEDMTGFALCRGLREDPDTEVLRILVLGSQCGELDRILAFECGADDFLPAPFSPRELVARVRALLRRDAEWNAPSAPSECHGMLTVDAETGRVEVNGRAADLTPTELRVLVQLVRGQGKVLARAEIVDAIAGAPDARSTRLVDAHVKAVRRKLGDAGRYIQSVRGVGYRFDVV